MTRCSQCGQEDLENLNYCRKCGSKLDDSVICPFCKTHNDNSSRFCKNCGKSFNINNSQSNPENIYNHQQLNLNSKKFNLMALLIGSVSIVLIYTFLDIVRYTLYNRFIITSETSDVLLSIFTFLSGLIGMYIFNQINKGENQFSNILLVSFIGQILLILFYGLMGAWIGTIGSNIVDLIITIIGAYVGNYIDNNAII